VTLEEPDQIAAACVVPPEENGGEDEDGPDGQGVLLQ
jgi:hypothetical protein